MSEETSQAQAHCAFCEATEAMSRLFRSFGPSENVASHFRQSRIEFLKGLRAILDERIEDMSRTSKGTRIVVE